MSNGISEGQARNIAQRAADSAVAPLKSDITNLKSEQRTLARRIGQLEDEMAKIASSIKEMQRALVQSLSALQDRVEATNKTTKALIVANESGFQRTLSATKTGFERTLSATQQVDEAVTRNTGALVEMEYLRLYGEAQAPLRFIESFAEEIDDRFAKAIEDVYLNRELYNQHFDRIYDEYDAKIRSIGEHIFELLENDFEPIVERSQQVPQLEYAKLSLEVDEVQVAVRSQLLDDALESLKQTSLQPLLGAEQALTETLDGDHDLGRDSDIAPRATVLVPVTVAISHDGKVMDSTMNDPDHQGKDLDSARDGISPLDNFNELLTDRTEHLQRHRVPRTAEELASLKENLQALAALGYVEERLLPGYYRMLDTYGLDKLSLRPSRGAQ